MTKSSVVREINKINERELELGTSNASWHDEYKGMESHLSIIAMISDSTLQIQLIYLSEGFITTLRKAM